MGLGTVGVLALCTLGATVGVHAAGGDDAAPAAMVAKILDSYEAGDGAIGTDASGLQPIPGEQAGSSGGGRGGASDDSPSNDRSSTRDDPPGAAPSRTPDPGADAPAPPPVDPTDPMSPEYNPYTTPGDLAYVTDAEKSAWLGREAVVRSCMSDAGFEYLDWTWWLGGSPQPAGQSPDEAAAWSTALRGAGEAGGGCRARAQQAADDAAAAGTPLTAPLPTPPGPEVPTEREQWLEFQSTVRACMAELGHEYRYWEYWNPAYDSSGTPAAMPPGLSDEARAAWSLAAFGVADPVGGAPKASGGCWASGLAASGYRTFD